MKPITTGLLKKFYQKISTVFAKKSDLDKNGYDEISGGKNLFDSNRWISKAISAGVYLGSIAYNDGKITISARENDAYTMTYWSDKNNYKYTPIKLKPDTKYTLTVKSNRSETKKGYIHVFNSDGSVLNVDNGFSNKMGFRTKSDGIIQIRFGVANAGDTITYENVYIREGEVVDTYEPYYPSNKMLDEENICQSREMMDIKMLGWSVPRECPIQNEVKNNQFIQKVGRIDLGSLYWEYVANGFKSASILNSMVDTKKAFCSKYKFNPDVNDTTGNVMYQSLNDMEFAWYSNLQYIYIKDTSYTDATTFRTAMQGVYLYYELETPITVSIDGNECSGRKDTVTNLLKPTLESTTRNGVTCTKNADGSYTLKGMNTSTDFFSFNVTNITIKKAGVYKLLGCPQGQSMDTTHMYLNNDSFSVAANDIGDGIQQYLPAGSYTVQIEIRGSETVNHTYKPMLTTNLSATYDDFVPYTGDTGSLNKDVADIRSRMVNNLTTTEEGYMLDARQGKRLLDVMNKISYADTSGIEKSDSNYIEDSSFAIIQYLRLISFNFSITISTDCDSDDIEIATLPDDIAPLTPINCTVMSEEGNCYSIEISKYITVYKSPTGSWDGNTLKGTVTYLK